MMMDVVHRQEAEGQKYRKTNLLVADQQVAREDSSSDDGSDAEIERLPLAPFTAAYWTSSYYYHQQSAPQAPKFVDHHPYQGQKASKRLRPGSAPDLPPPINTLSRVALSRIDKAANLFLDADNVTVTGTLSGYRMIRATHGCLNFGAYYFEVEILPPITENAHIRLGWATRKANLEAPVGFDQYSFGYRDQMGSKVHQSVRIDNYGEPFEAGDVIGCFIYLATKEQNPSVNQIRFFKNAKDQGPAFQGYEIERDVYYPAISLFNGARVRVNFGPTFIYGSIHRSLGLHPNPMSEMFPLSTEMRKEHEAQIAEIRRAKGVDDQDDGEYLLPDVSAVLTTRKVFPAHLQLISEEEEGGRHKATYYTVEIVEPASQETEAVVAEDGRRQRRVPVPRNLSSPSDFVPMQRPRPVVKRIERDALQPGRYVRVTTSASPHQGQVGVISNDNGAGWRGGWRIVEFADGMRVSFRPSDLEAASAPSPTAQPQEDL